MRSHAVDAPPACAKQSAAGRAAASARAGAPQPLRHIASKLTCIHPAGGASSGVHCTSLRALDPLLTGQPARTARPLVDALTRQQTQGPLQRTGYSAARLQRAAGGDLCARQASTRKTRQRSRRRARTPRKHARGTWFTCSSRACVLSVQQLARGRSALRSVQRARCFKKIASMDLRIYRGFSRTRLWGGNKTTIWR
jgi:hypothetical protein